MSETNKDQTITSQKLSEGLIPSGETVWTKLLGPNYKVRRAAIFKMVNDSLLYLAIAPYTLGAIADILPAKVKAGIALGSIIAKAVITLKQGWLTKQQDVSGGNVIQDPSGNMLGTLEPKK